MKRLKRIVASLAICLLSGCAGAEPPSFDHDKAKQLAPEKRRQYDVVFFNEMAIWKGGNSFRYGADMNDETFRRRAEEFERMAADGHFISWTALQFLDMRRGLYRRDENAKEALRLLIQAAETGDASAQCALIASGIDRAILPYEQGKEIGRKMMLAGAAQGHPACKAYLGSMMLLGNVVEVPQDRMAALPLLFETAKENYFVATRALFTPRLLKSLSKELDYKNLAELDRALCWGRVAGQFTYGADFGGFVDDVRDYARKHDRPDLIERSKRFDPRLVPLTQTVVTADDCIPLEKGE